MVRALAAAAVAGVLGLAAGDRAAAHPHVFVDAGIELRFDDAGRLAAVRIVWVYDDFTSMLVLGDRGLAPGPGDTLAAADRAALTGFDMAWQPGFAGDSYLLAGDAPVALGPPTDWTADYVQGRVVTSHVRAVADPPDPALVPVTLQLYDPGFYTAYTIAADPVVRGRPGCTATVYGPDPAAADATLQAVLEELAGSGGDPEADFPAVGAAYAEEVRLTCADPS